MAFLLKVIVIKIKIYSQLNSLNILTDSVVLHRQPTIIVPSITSDLITNPQISNHIINQYNITNYSLLHSFHLLQQSIQKVLHPHLAVCLLRAPLRLLLIKPYNPHSLERYHRLHLFRWAYLLLLDSFKYMPGCGIKVHLRNDGGWWLLVVALPGLEIVEVMKGQLRVRFTLVTGFYFEGRHALEFEEPAFGLDQCLYVVELGTLDLGRRISVDGGWFHCLLYRGGNNIHRKLVLSKRQERSKIVVPPPPLVPVLLIIIQRHSFLFHRRHRALRCFQYFDEHWRLRPLIVRQCRGPAKIERAPGPVL